MISEQRLMRYATAIAHDDFNYVFGDDHKYPLPDASHPNWVGWKRTAEVVIKIADTEHPPPPGSTEEQLPDHILGMIVPRPYFSTACETARALQSAAVRHPDHVDELSSWKKKMHDRCRLNNKFTGVLCACNCHQETEST
jgi:hypothetical protein